MLCWCLKETGKRKAIFMNPSSFQEAPVLPLLFSTRVRNLTTEGWECEYLGFIYVYILAFSRDEDDRDVGKSHVPIYFNCLLTLLIGS